MWSGSSLTRLTICAIVLIDAGSSSAVPITPIADSTGGYSSFSLPSVNTSGTVAFRATTSGSAKILTGSGGPVTTAFDSANFAGTQVPTGDPSINNAGQIGLFSGAFVYRLDGGTLTTIFDESGVLGFFHALSTANDGTVYFTVSELGVQYYKAGSGGPGQQLGFAAGISDGFGRPGVSADGLQNVVNFHKPTGGVDAIILNGVTVLSAATVFLDPAFGRSNYDKFTDADVNSAGTVIFSANYSSFVDRVVTIHGSTITTLSGGRAIPAINDNGIVAALFTGGGKQLMFGQGSFTDTLISVGDSFMGSTVTDLGFEHDGLSDSNQLAFYAALADGRQGIYVATVPEPSVIAGVGAAIIALLVRRRRNA